MWISKDQKNRLNAIRANMDVVVEVNKDTPSIINEIPELIRVWKPAAYTIGDVRVYEGIPYKCVQTHDSSANPAWTPNAVPALWMQYHGTTIATARPWVTPLGSHDIYKVGEFMIWTDGLIYECLSDTNYSPSEYAQAWKQISI